MKNFLLIVSCFFASCTFINAKDISIKEASNLYNPTSKILHLNKDILFWENRIDRSNNHKVAYQKLAGLYTAKYKIEGRIIDLTQAIDFLNKALNLPGLNNAPALRQMARLKIMQHNFCEALDLAIWADEIGSEKRQTQFLLFDLYNEIGDEKSAEYYLNLIANKKDFDYYIRLSKWADGMGELNDAINFLLKAKSYLSPNDFERLNWVYSNLGDYYGHDKNIEASYESYKIALQYDKSDWYSMKGISWIAFSHTKDLNKALEIIDVVNEFNQNVALDYLRYQILDMQNASDKEVIRNSILGEVQKLEYGQMYNDLLADLYISEDSRYEELLSLAKHEVSERPVAESYALLGLAYIKNSDFNEAYKIYKQYVKGQTFEPKVYYRLSELVSHFPDLAKEFNLIIGDATYELGPFKMKQLQ